MLLPFKKLTTVAVAQEKVLDYDFKKSYPNINQHTMWADIEPHIRQGVRSYILPYIGDKIYDDICTKIADGTALTTEQAKFWEYLKDVAAHYAVAAALAKGKTTLAAMGAVENSGSSGSTTTSLWGFKTTLWQATQDADRMMEEMLRMLEGFVDRTTPISYFVTNWKNEPAYSELSAGFFRQPGEFQEFHNIGRSLRTFKLLVPTMDECAEHLILPILGQAQFDTLITAIKDNTLNDAQKKLVKHVRRALAKRTVYEASVGMPIVVERDGFRVISNVDAVDQRAYGVETIQGAIQGLRESADRSCRTATADLVAFLYANPDTYPLWRDSEANKSAGSAAGGVLAEEFGAVFI